MPLVPGNEKAGRIVIGSARPWKCKMRLQVGVAGGEHGGETRHFLLAAAFFARLFKRPAAAHDFQRALAVNFFLEPAQCAFHRLAFF